MSDDFDLVSAQGISSYAFDIPEDEFFKLVADLEKNRRNPERREQVDKVLNALRPRMAIIQPTRKITLQRLFCIPFEDLLRKPSRPKPVPGLIPRPSLGPVWTYLLETIDIHQFQVLETQLAKTPPTDRQAIARISREFWKLAAVTLKPVVARAQTDRSFRTQLLSKLGDELSFFALMDIAAFQQVAEEIERFKTSLGPSEPQVGTRLNRTVLKAFQSIVEVDPPLIITVIYILMARMGERALIFDVLRAIAEQGEPEMVKEIARQTTSALAGQAENELEELEDEFDNVEIKEGLTRKVASTLSEVKAIRQTLTANQEQRMDGNLAKMTRRITEKVDREIISGAEEKALALYDKISREVVGFGVALDEDMASENEELVEQLEDEIIALRLSMTFADDLGLGGKIEFALGNIHKGIEENALAAIENLDPFGVSDTELKMAKANLYTSTRMIELTAGSEVADRLRRAGLEKIRAYEVTDVADAPDMDEAVEL